MIVPDTEPVERNYGEWPSPVTAERAAAASGSLAWVSGRGDETWWCASDPATATVRLMRRDAHGAVVDVLGAGRNARNRVCGYGGRPYALFDGGFVYTEFADQRLYCGERPLTPVDPTAWYVDPLVVGAEAWCIRERTTPGAGDPAARTSRDIVAVPLSGAGPLRVVAGSHHFLAGPRLSPDGRRLAWLGWDHPRMPWDGTDLMVADLVDGVAVNARRVLGGPDVSVAQAEWIGNDALYAMADPDGWWNLHRVSPAGEAECVLPMPEECAGAQWRIGATWFAPAGDSVVLRHGVGAQQLALWDPASGELRDLAPGWNDFGWSVWADERHAVVIGGSEHEPTGVLRVPLDGGPPSRMSPPPAEDPYRSVPERRIADGVHYVYYPPRNPLASAPAGPKPPLIVTVHGGPTSHTDGTPSVELSLFTSRGFAVASVDYGGSTGYGRAYRERLRHQWGVVDVADCVTVVRALAGEIDSTRVAIRGESAGGWTTLAALAHSDEFCAGAAYYPIADATRWSGEHTHDFESRYLDGLVRPADRERVSPLQHADRITSPLVLLQGVEDPICPPEHAESIAAAVRAPWHRLLLFDGEGHGFRKAGSITDSLRAEVDLYRYAMRLDIADVG